jgi:alpha-mannosidase
MRLSLLRSPTWPDPTADRGKHVIEYVLYPHAGRWQDAQTVQRGYEYNNALIAVLTETHKGVLPPVHSFVRLSPANVVLTSIKKAEDSKAWIIQWYESLGKDTEAALTLPRVPQSAVVSNFLEADGSALAIERNSLQVKTPKNSVVTVKVSF